VTQDVEFADDRQRLLFARAQLGEQVRDFLVSPVGRYLHERAKEDLEQVKIQLLHTNTDSWFGRRKARRLRETAAHCERFMKYCVDAITDGEVAFRELE
jgi:hypothetical protein